MFLPNLNQRCSLYINGQWREAAGAPLTVVDPANATVIWRGAAATASDIDVAAIAARIAFPGWASRSQAERNAICLRFRELLLTHVEMLATTISSEVGKPLWEARTEVTSMAAKVAISIQAQGERAGESSASVTDGQSVVRHRPHGVLAVLGPYNFPGHLPNGHIVPALLAGNTVVFKPSQYAPQTAIATVALWEQAGLPPGVLNLVNGASETGIALAAHPTLNGILFTGSYRTGTALHRQFAGQPEKLLALEMGGNNPLVVWHTANLDAAVHHAILSAFVSAGQRCTCARRIIVSDDAQGRAFTTRLVQVTSQLQVAAGDTFPEPFMGPVVSAEVAQVLLAAQADLIQRGGDALLLMQSLKAGTGLLSPGIIDVSAALDVPDEEFFGPLLQLQRVADFDAAITAANATRYGLAAGLLADDGALWQRFLQQSRAGIVNWNRPTTGAASTAPFGGIGRSGNHRPSAYYAADYCAYPVASMQTDVLQMPSQLPPGMHFEHPSSENGSDE